MVRGTIDLNVPGEILFLIILLVLGLISKNQSIIFSVLILLVVRLSGLGDRLFPSIEKHGVNIGVIAITVAVLVPIATGKIQLMDLYVSLKSSSGVIALLSGILVALFASYGIQLLEQSPQVTTFLVLGTILAVLFFHGVSVGPLIGAGIAMVIMRIYNWIESLIS